MALYKRSIPAPRYLHGLTAESVQKWWVMPRFARKKDATHEMVADAFRKAGWSVVDTYRAPDCPDFFAASNGRTVAVEVKSKGGKLTASQEKFRQTWTGEYYVVSTLDEAQQILGAK